MKRSFNILTLLSVLALIVSSCSNHKEKSVNLKSELDSLNYAMGFANGKIVKDYHLANDTTGTGFEDLMKGIEDGMKATSSNEELARAEEMGTMIGSQLRTNKDFYGDSTLTVDFKQIRQGLINGMMNFKDQMTAEEAGKFFNEAMERQTRMRNEAAYGANKKAGEDFLAENAKREGVVTTESGLQYEVITPGKGAKPAESDQVKVHYHGTLVDGTVFDSSVQRGEPAQFGVNQVIRGWVEGLQLMPVGSKFKFYIPQDLAYGAQDQGTIKPYSTLVFEVELLDIVK